MVTEEISLYFHIPFCSKKCPYCHFYVLPNKQELKDLLSHGLLLEWKKNLSLLANKKITSVYFGGGTPSLFGPSAIAKIIQQIFLLPVAEECEITLEVNPENALPDLMKEYQRIGINRVSLGIQSFDDELLKLLGRTHSAQKATTGIETVYHSGIHNISIDLMYEIPHQTLQSWQQTLKQVEHLPITHLSLYNLTIEPETVFFKKRAELSSLLPSPETSLEMLKMGVEKLEQFGLKRYEISAFAKKGFSSRHNTGYWTGRSFLGFGPSAFSYFEGKRFRNVAHLKQFTDRLEKGLSPVDFEEKLPYPQNQKELLAVELRLLKGVDLTAFQRKYGKLAREILVQIIVLKEKGWVKEKEGILSLTEEGLLFYDSVAETII